MEQQTKAMRELSRRAFPEPDVVLGDAPALIEAARAQRRRQAAAAEAQTETCEAAGPNVIVQVVTRPAPEQDTDALDLIHKGLAQQDILPHEHVVDGGYSSPDSIHLAQ
ncbi:hypothetical protein [Streptomyces albireticuli]|uniref:hypothetical protein n=1 Tax=Streptomyces albireticuli TaxID=1940 RepID=UPI001B80AE4F|nr:hypothetical protein [Streptomyces albireticuli]MCD9145466.1 hypothetical protein [Streptomyces albireticuli]MCD9164969.1 hypothetical protein [Streptomyces albireticuli]MCD9195440.1 hypothetical protein [Streptomyces albireticuli]